MISTPSLLIVTADDFSITANVSQECDKLVERLGEGRHVYGCQHYPSGHCVVFRKASLRRDKRLRLREFPEIAAALKATPCGNKIEAIVELCDTLADVLSSCEPDHFPAAREVLAKHSKPQS